MNKLYIFSGKGFAKEVASIAMRNGMRIKCFVEKDEKQNEWMGIPTILENEISEKIEDASVAIGDTYIREKVVNMILKKYPLCEFPNIIDPSTVFICPESVLLGKGIFMNSLCFISSNVKIGDFCQLNVGTEIGHDVELSNYVTTGMGTKIGGYSKIGTNVRIGSNVFIKEGTTINKNIIIGAGTVVVKDLIEEGTYVGIPAKKLIKEK